MPNDNTPNAEAFYDLVANFWGKKASAVGYSVSTATFTCILYDAFWFTCGLGGEYGTFTCAFDAGRNHAITTVLGQSFSLNTDEESILADLALADRYARLRLPDKYLHEFDTTHGYA